MGYQALQGVTITPKGAKNRFVNQNWAASQAFGGWIFNSDCNIGYSNQPTQINFKIILESDSNINSLTPKTFDITKDDLKCTAEEGGRDNESLFDIDFNGVKFTDFILYSYNLDIQPQQKTLSVSFRDYSVILDKIYIGLIKRQGNQFIKTSYAAGEVPVVCPDCTFSSYTGMGIIHRDLDFGSYAGINGQSYDNFDNYIYGQIYDSWNELFASSVKNPTFDLNGGYLILGTEEMYSEVCSTIPEVKYSFNQLLNSLRVRGVNLTGDFLQSFVTGSPYTQNYPGTLREVLNNWSSDFGLQFYCSGKSFIGLDLKKEIDISQILQVSDSKTTIGSSFDGTNIAIGNYKENYSLENTYKQSVITADVRPKDVKIESRDVKNFVRFVPLHPLDFYSPDYNGFTVDVAQTNANFYRPLTGALFANYFGRTANGDSYLNIIGKRMSNFTNRLFTDIDTSIALIKYDKDLRDIYCADRAIASLGTISDSSNGFTTDLYANFASLGFIPKVRLSSSVSKESVLRTYNNASSQNISMNPDFYEIYIGYYYSSLSQEVASFEQSWASSMYKYGALNLGTTNTAPFIIRDKNDLLQPTGGFYGSQGASLLRITNSFTPNAALHPKIIEAPYYNLMPYGFFGFNSNNYYIASIENEWGLTQEDFRRQLYEPLSPVCEQMFVNTQSIQQLATDLPFNTQQFAIKEFAPSFHSDVDKVYNLLKTEIDNLSTTAADELGFFAMGTDNKLHQECAKIHIAIIPNIRTHPNVRISFSPKDYYSSFNRIMANSIVNQLNNNYANYLKEKPKNICDYSSMTTMCDDIISGLNQNNPTNPSYSCQSVDDPNMIQYAGWPVTYNYSGNATLTPQTKLPPNTSDFVMANNARSLYINIIRNPITDMATIGSDGEYYYNTLQAAGIQSLTNSSSSTNIIYPICNKPIDTHLSYIGVMNTNVSRENRAPAFTEIYGTPVNQSNNNVLTVRTINNTIDPDIQPILDPNSKRFIKYTTVVTGNTTKVLHSIQEYHNFISGLNSYQANYPTKSADFSIIGSPNLFGNFLPFVNPKSGLNSFSFSITDNGVETNLSFANKPPILPKQEAILNKIGPRLKPK